MTSSAPRYVVDHFDARARPVPTKHRTSYVHQFSKECVASPCITQSVSAYGCPRIPRSDSVQCCFPSCLEAYKLKGLSLLQVVHWVDHTNQGCGEYIGVAAKPRWSL
jgi:hypothetical protein